MDALMYEYLIRKAYNCGRGGAGGKADADIYRRMERAANALTMGRSPGTNGNLEYDYRSAAITVSMNLREALHKVAQGHFFQAGHEGSREKLEQLAARMAMSTDRKLIDETIEAGHDIFKALGLPMR